VEVVAAGVFDGEAEVGGEDDVLWAGEGVELERAAVEAEEQRIAGAGVEKMKLAGGADEDVAAAVERDGGGVVVGCDAGVGQQTGVVAVDLEPAGDERVAGGDGAHGDGRGLLGPNLSGMEEECGHEERANPRGQRPQIRPGHETPG
jgi:hypothetical protein